MGLNNSFKSLWSYAKSIKTLHKDKSFKGLLKHSVNYGLGDVIAQVIGFLLIPLYTKFLTTSDYGTVDLLSTICAFAIPLMKLGLPGSVTRQYFDYRDNPVELKNYITTIYKLLNWSAIIIGSVLILILFFTRTYFLVSIPFWPFLVLPIITAGLGANNQLQQKVIQNEERSSYSVRIRLAFTFFSILMSITFISYFRMGVLGFILADFIVAIAFFIQAYFFLKPYITGIFSKEMAREGLRYGSGILPSHVSGAAAPLINKTLLVNMGSLGALGVFSIGLRFIMPLEIVYNMINVAFTPIYNGLRTDQNTSELKKNVRFILLISFAVFTLAQVIGPPVMRWMLPESYYSAISLLPILSIAFIARTIYGINVAEIYYCRKTKYVSIIIIGGLIVNTLFCLLLVEFFQEKAIAWAYSINIILWAVLSFLYKKKVSDFDSYSREILFFIIASTCISIISFSLN